MADDAIQADSPHTTSSTNPAPGDTESSQRRPTHARWLFGALAVSAVVLVAAAAFAWTRAGERDDARRTQQHALVALRTERSAAATCRDDLGHARKQISEFEQHAQIPLGSASAGMAVLDQLLVDVHALQTAGTNLGTPEAENTYNEALARVHALEDPLNAALNPFPGQLTTLRTEFPTLPT